MDGLDPGPPPASLGRHALSHADLLARHGDALTLGGKVAPPSPTELEFSGVTPGAVAAALERRTPLGLTPEQWDQLRGEIEDALVAEGIHHDSHINLQGSATKFHGKKPFPKTQNEVLERGRAQFRDPLEKTLPKWKASPYAGRDAHEMPDLLFFDAEHALGLSWAKSDLDIALHGGAVVQRMRHYQREQGLSNDEIEVPQGNYVAEGKNGVWFRAKHTRAAFAHLNALSKRWSKTLGRPVNFCISAEAPDPAAWVVREAAA